MNTSGFTIIELDAEKSDRISSKVKTVIEGDGTDPDVFREANPADRKVVAALTNTPRVILEICEMAQDIAPEARTILRSAETENRITVITGSSTISCIQPLQARV